MDDLFKKLGDDAPQLMKDNKGALIGALIGYAISNDRKAQSVLLGAIAGAVMGDKKDGS